MAQPPTAPDAVAFAQLDVFADRAGAGNPLGVVLDGRGFDDAAMQAFAAWTNLVETTFVLPPSQPGADYRVRIFTPSREIPFAGHPSLGTAHAVIEAGLAAPRDLGDGRRGLVQDCAAGQLPVTLEADPRGGEALFVQAPGARVLRVAEPLEADAAGAALADALAGLPTGALAPALVEGGRCWWVVEAADEAALRGWRPDHAAIRALAAATGSLGICAWARAADPAAWWQVAVRALPCGIGIDEDPASGAANGLLGSMLRQREPHGPLADGYAVSQGREIGRDARLLVRIAADGAVRVGGRTQTVIRGEVAWPPGPPRG